MAEFAYKARDMKGNLVNGAVDASGEGELAALLKGRGLYLVHFKEKQEKKTFIGSISFGKITRRDLIEFTIHLATVLSAGIPILEGLQDLEDKTKNSRFRGIIKSVREGIHGGSGLSSALSRHPEVFPQAYVNMVKAGEASGNVDMILQELTGFLEWQEELSANVRKASVYPIMVFAAVGVLLTILFTFAFPRIIGILQGMNVPLPLITRVVIGISTFFRDSWWLIFLAIAAAVTGTRLLGKTAGGRLWLDKRKLGFPIVGNLVRKIALSRFAHHLGLLWRAGIDISQSLTLVEGVVGNRVISDAIKQAREEVLAGESLSRSLAKRGEFSSLVIRMISIGEVSGEMDKSLSKVCQYYDKEIPAAVKKIFSVMEPLIIVLLAFVVLGVALSMYLPLYTVLGNLGK
ncbi:MAG: type II secretion system F family protein [Syntrophales bacterium]